MGSLITALSGKKTYAAMAAIFVCGGLQALGVEIPDYVWQMLGATGGLSLRLAIAKVEKAL